MVVILGISLSATTVELSLAPAIGVFAPESRREKVIASHPSPILSVNQTSYIKLQDYANFCCTFQNVHGVYCFTVAKCLKPPCVNIYSQYWILCSGSSTRRWRLFDRIRFSNDGLQDVSSTLRYIQPSGASQIFFKALLKKEELINIYL